MGEIKSQFGMNSLWNIKREDMNYLDEVGLIWEDKSKKWDEWENQRESQPGHTQKRIINRVKLCCGNDEVKRYNENKGCQINKGDRFIPCRRHSKLWIALTEAHEDGISFLEIEGNKEKSGIIHAASQKDLASQVVRVSDLYKTHVLGIRPPQSKTEKSFLNRNILSFSCQGKITDNNQLFHLGGPAFQALTINPDINQYFSRNSRKISKLPFKVLDAPTLKDDFYLNLVDWGHNNQIAVGLDTCVYLWSATTSRVTKLCDIRSSLANLQHFDDTVTSVSWTNEGSEQLLSVGTNSGSVQIWDVIGLKKIHEYRDHRERVGALAWNHSLLVSGSRDKKIIMRDIRSSQPVIHKLLGHKQEICGLKWSHDHQMLASGGNDNNLFIWNIHSTQPIMKLQSHTAAVKALSWSPHQHGLLISGGGSLDRTIRIWNTISREQVKCIDTGSQVCNLQFCKRRNEFVSTHGYSENQVTVWNYPDLDKLAVLTGHTQRVVHLAMSPDGDTIATGAGDETLRFWNISDDDERNKQSQLKKTFNSSLLLPQKNYLR